MTLPGEYLQLEELYDEVIILKMTTPSNGNLFAIRKAEKWGITSRYGGGFIEPQFENYSSTKNTIALKKDSIWNIYGKNYDKLGIIDDNIIRGHQEHYYIASKNGRLALVNEKRATEYVFDEISGPSENEGCFLGKKDGEWNAYLLTGSKILEPTKVIASCLKALNEYKISLHGYGPIKLGMDIKSIEKAVGIKNVNEDNSTADCKVYNFIEGFPNIRLLCEKKNGKMILERIYVNDKSIKTKSGIGIGSSEKEILDAYGDKMKKESHKYKPQSNYYYYVPTDKKDQNYRINFDFDSEKVVHFSVGRKPAIFYVEGCF